MRAAKKVGVDRRILHELVPLNALSDSRFGKLADKIIVEEVKAGNYLFRKGDRDGNAVYLLEGRINLIDGFRKVTGEVEAGTDTARYPIANLQPRAASARAAQKSVIAYVDSNLLDVFLTCDQSEVADVVEISGADTGDWMTRVLQSEVFSKLPPAKIQSLLMKMRPFSLAAGETVIRQGDEGDYFYTIHEGRCVVTRREMPDGSDLQLAELKEGDSFGEDALVSNTRRNATVTMLTDGTLMRLAKQDFVDLLKKQLVRQIDRKTAYVMVEEGAVWLDVRTQDEYERGSFEDSVNIPLADLRDEMSELVFNATYILCCDTGGRSGSAAFMLGHKGFDVYVLEGGIAALTPDELRAAGMLQQHAPAEGTDEAGTVQYEAEVIDFDAGSHEPDVDSELETTSDSFEGPGGTLSDQECLLTELQQEKISLVAEIDSYRETERRLTEQLELLGAELGEAGEKLGELYSQAKSDAEEKQSLRDQYAALQEQTDTQLQAHESRLEESVRRIDELQSQLDSAGLEAQAGTEAVSRDLGEVQAKNDLLREELEAAVEKTGQLEAQLASALEADSRRASDSADALQEQQELVQQLQSELQRLNDVNGQLQQGLAASSEQEQSTVNELRSRLQETEGRFAGLSSELEEARGELERKEAELVAGSGRITELDQANREMHASLEEARNSITQLQAESGGSLQEQQACMDELRAELAASAEANDRLRQEVEEALGARDKVREELQDRLDEVGGHTARSGEEIAGLRHQLGESAERLAAEQQRGEELQRQNNEQARKLESLQAEIDTARGETESTATAARERQQALETELEELRNELANAAEHSRGTTTDLESAAATIQELERDRETLNAGLQDAEARLNELGEKSTTLESDKQDAVNSLSALQTELQELQQKYTAAEEEKTGLLNRLEALEEEHTAELADKSGNVEEMQASLVAARDEIGSLQLLAEESKTQLEALQQEVSEREENRRLIEEQLDASREQNRQLRLEMQQYEQHAKDAEAEYQESTRKAHNDLTRKNDNEKELQGQIDRLRKQLEQATLDQHKRRESALGDLDNLREQLHAERRERAEERAEMAARQRELKEQLASIATEHEANLGRHSGAMEEARDAIRAEEQERVRELLEAQAQTEDQILKLQQELSRAHEEITELTQQQKHARQANVDLLQEQNQQAVSAIAQLELQLRQLSEERDSSLDEQKELRERMNALRGEVEVARGLMNMSGQGLTENPARLRTELEEAKKNVEIAVRLRAEAEAARDRVARERDQLRSRLDSGEGKSAQSHPSSVDKHSAAALLKEKPAVSGGQHVAAGQDRHTGMPVQRNESGGLLTQIRNRWLALVIVLFVSGVIALVMWFMPGTEISLQPDEVVSGNNAVPVVADTLAVPAVDPVPVVDTARLKSTTQPEPARFAAVPDEQEKITADETYGEARVKPVRSFRDALQGGMKGPVMVELPAGSYKMGSLGNSLNYDESPRHKVTLPGFSISKYEVTFAEYDQFARATGRRLPYDESWGRGDRPVINVSWKDAVSYTEWLSMQSGKSYRLPTEAEWEYAIRAGTGSRYWWDDREAGVNANCFNCGSEWDNLQTSPVGSFPANRFGLHDMTGNVQEWIEDCYQAGYADAPVDGSAWLTPECTQRSVRGGGYTSPLDTLRSARRGQYDQDTRLDNIGFRVVRDN